MRVLGIDPGFAALGWVEAESTLAGLTFTRVGCIHTEKDPSRSAAQDLLVRCGELTRGILGCNLPGLVCIEAMSFPRNASSAVKLGASHGVLAAVVTACFECDDVSVYSPQAARKIVTGLKKPTEEEAHDMLRVRHDELHMMTRDLRKKDTPHILDAAAQVVAWDMTTR